MSLIGCNVMNLVLFLMNLVGNWGRRRAKKPHLTPVFNSKNRGMFLNSATKKKDWIFF